MTALTVTPQASLSFSLSRRLLKLMSITDRHEEKGTTEDEMVGRHHRLYGHEFEQSPGVGDGLGGMAC